MILVYVSLRFRYMVYVSLRFRISLTLMYTLISTLFWILPIFFNCFGPNLVSKVVDLHTFFNIGRCYGVPPYKGTYWYLLPTYFDWSLTYFANDRCKNLFLRGCRSILQEKKSIQEFSREYWLGIWHRHVSCSIPLVCNMQKVTKQSHSLFL